LAVTPFLVEGLLKARANKEEKMSAPQDIEYTVQIWKEGNQFVAHAMPLDVMSSGKTADEAWKALDEAAHLFLVTTADMGNLSL
jgi:predicted RNase H-like HicB family nuclease